MWVRIDLKLDWLKQNKIQAQIEVERKEAIFERSPGKDNKRKRSKILHGKDILKLKYGPKWEQKTQNKHGAKKLSRTNNN